MKNTYKHLSVLCLFLIYTECKAQLPSFHWGSAVQGEASESVTDICTDADGNVLLVGEFQGTIDLDPSAEVLNKTTNGLDDIFIQKIDTEGNLVWAKTIGGFGYDYGRAIATDSDGNVFVCGNFKSFMDADPGSTEHTIFSNGEADAFVVKLDAAGDFLWVKNIGDTGGDYAIDMVVSSTNTIYITGGFYSNTIDLNPGTETDLHTNNGEMDLFVMELDSNGNYIFGKTFGGVGREEVEGIAIDQFNSLYLTGVFEDTVNFNPDENEVVELSSNGMVDIFVEKLDNTGELLWAKSFGGAFTEQSSGLGVDDFGNVYTVGYFLGDIDFDPELDESFVITSSDLGESNAFIQKLDAAGAFEWANTFGGAEMDKANAIEVDGLGNIYVTGFYEGAVDFDSSSEDVIIEDAGEQDVFIQKLNPNGGLTWVKSIGGNLHDIGNAIAIDALENVYVAGSFLDSIDADPSENESIYNAMGLDDAFLMKLSQRELSLNETFDLDNVKLYPNPTKGMAYLTFNAPQISVQLSVRNVLGQLLYSKSFENVSTIPITTPEGLYFIELNQSNKNTVLKLIHE